MAAITRIYTRVIETEDGLDVIDFGSLVKPKEFSNTGYPRQSPKIITIAAGATVKVWDWAIEGDFSWLWMQADGYLWQALKVDKPVGSGDNSGAGTAINYPKKSISCCTPETFNSMSHPVNISSANYAGSAFHAATEEGRIYEIWLKNPGSEAVNVLLAWSK